jgi:hypothetical protein
MSDETSAVAENSSHEGDEDAAASDKRSGCPVALAIPESAPRVGAALSLLWWTEGAVNESAANETLRSARGSDED